MAFGGYHIVNGFYGDSCRPIPFRTHLINSQTKSAINSRVKRIIKLDPHNCNFNELILKLKSTYPVLNDEEFHLTYKGEYGSKKQIFNQQDFHTILNEMGDDRSLYVLYNDDLETFFLSDNTDMPHVQFFCDACCYPLKRFRYKCQVCMDYNICWLCLQKSIHTMHRLRYVSITRSAGNTKIGEMDFNFCKLKKEIGKGYSGKVHLAEAQKKVSGQKNVAIKILTDAATNKMQDDFRNEMEILESVGFHENVVRFLGYCFNPMAIVLEYVVMKIDGSEMHGLIMYLMYLRKKRLDAIDHRELESFALQIARGMEHLESLGIVHRDLAARNVLIDSTKTLKITDFGLSRIGEYEGPRGVIVHPWASPEVITQRLYSNKSDVWAFAVVLWEIATLGAVPYHGLSYGEIEGFVKKGGRLKKPGNVTAELFNVMTKCWAQTAKKRPTFKQLVEKLNDFKWMDCAYIPFASVNCVFVLQPAMDVYETKLEELLKHKVVPGKRNRSRSRGKNQRR